MSMANNYYDSFGVQFFPQMGGHNFVVFGITFHSHLDDRDMCSMRDGVILTIFDLSFFIGKKRNYESLS